MSQRPGVPVSPGADDQYRVGGRAAHSGTTRGGPTSAATPPFTCAPSPLGPRPGWPGRPDTGVREDWSRGWRRRGSRPRRPPDPRPALAGARGWRRSDSASSAGGPAAARPARQRPAAGPCTLPTATARLSVAIGLGQGGRAGHTGRGFAASRCAGSALIVHRRDRRLQLIGARFAVRQGRGEQAGPLGDQRLVPAARGPALPAGPGCRPAGSGRAALRR